VAGQGVRLAGGRHQIPSLSHSLSCGTRERRKNQKPPLLRGRNRSTKAGRKEVI